jgi:[protein-PII] uridylyltransferase
MSFFKYRTRSLEELEMKELVTKAERKQLTDAYDFLLRVRTDMHYHADRAADVLTKNLQPAIATNLGHSERSPSKRIEKFMREVYSHSRNIYLITRTLEQRLALLPRQKSLLSLSFLTEARRKRQEQIIDGFKISDGEIIATSPKVFREDPRRLMRVFLHAQQRGLRLHPDLAQLTRKELELVDRKFLYDSHVAETILEILNQRGNVAPILRAMHETGLLGKFIPEFGKLTCLVQHEFYHQYTADEHTLVCLEQLDRVWEANQPPHSNYSELFQRLERPFLLYLALLLHDVGKADDHGQHSEAGSAAAARVAKRLKLDETTTEILQLIIEHHLLMARVSQRRDLDDAAEIRNFARVVKNPETLAMLTIHTFVDSLATSDRIWNGFKDTLLWELHLKTMPLLVGATEFVREEAKHREQLMTEVESIKPEELSHEEITAHFAALPPRYFQIHSAKEILDDVLLTHRFMRLQIAEEANALAPVVNWHNEPDRGYNIVKVCTWDRAGLFSKIAGSFSACGLNILSAQIFTRADGIVLDTFFVNDAKSGMLASVEQRDKFELLLGEVLTTDEDRLGSLIEKQKSRPLYQSYEGDRMETAILFDNESSESRTVIEIETEDRVGLLYAISQTLSQLDLNISAAKINTEKGAAIDSFYVSELGGEKVLEVGRQKQIEEKLREAIGKLLV